MASITNNPLEQQREKTATFSSSASLDVEDDFHRLLAQAKSLTTFMVANDNMDGLPVHTISNLLWLLSDRLDDMEASFNKLTRGFVQ